MRYREIEEYLAAHYRRFADVNICSFFDAASVGQTGPMIGIHRDAKNHEHLGDGLAQHIFSIFDRGVNH